MSKFEINSIRLAVPVFICLGILFLTAGCSPSPGDRSEPAKLTGKYKDYNLLFIILDTLRADRLGCYGYLRNTSPQIDKLAAKSILFENTFVHLPFTLPSHASIFTGLYPQNTTMIYNYGYLPDTMTTLAELLKKNGYETGAVVSTAVLKKDKNLDQGFDDYFHNFNPEEEKASLEIWEVQGPADEANRYAFKWLEENRNRKFFFWTHYYDIHAPYVEHEGFKDRFDPEAEDFTYDIKNKWETPPRVGWKYLNLTNYDRQVAFTDYHLGKLIEKLEGLGLLDKTVIVITSDHGNGLYQHRDIWTHGDFVYEEQIKIPLLFILPDLQESLRIENIVESVDIMPTLLALLGINYRHRMDGRSMIPLVEKGKWGKEERAYALSKIEKSGAEGTPLRYQFCVRTPTEKLIQTIQGENEFYDLRRDPFEKENIYSTARQQQSRLVSKLTAEGLNWARQTELAKITSPKIDKRTLKELKTLGYIQ